MGSVSTAYGQEVVAEAQFLRWCFTTLSLQKCGATYLILIETITYAAGNYNASNAGPIWIKIEADFTAAMACCCNTATSWPC